MDFILELLLPEKWESSFWMNLFAYAFVLAACFLVVMFFLYSIPHLLLFAFELLKIPSSWVHKALNILRFMVTRKTVSEDYQYFTEEYKRVILRAIAANIKDKKLVLHLETITKSDGSILEDNRKFFKFLEMLGEPDKISTLKTQKMHPKLWKKLSVKEPDAIINDDNTEFSFLSN